MFIFHIFSEIPSQVMVTKPPTAAKSRQPAYVPYLSFIYWSKYAVYGTPGQLRIIQITTPPTIHSVCSGTFVVFAGLLSGR